jgi:4-hydroxythreonine-4-phosphate dehydrogenase
MSATPRLLITMGDVAGIGPEIIVRAWPELCSFCRPVVVGDAGWLLRSLSLIKHRAAVQQVRVTMEAEPAPELIPCVVCDGQDLSRVEPGRVSAIAGRAAYGFLCRAIDLTLTDDAAGIVTAPLNKEGLRAAGLNYPGHTEILAERTGTRRFGMMLYSQGLAVIHVTLHVALRDVFGLISGPAIVEKVRLLDDILTRMLDRRPRIGVSALNPHASDGGLFGHEERDLIEPAVAEARSAGINATGPWPSDTLFLRASRGEFDGIVAMYHDQGHIALKLMGGLSAVNISVGLPIVRTSVAHGTAYDIAGRGIADATSLIEATRVASRLALR